MTTNGNGWRISPLYEDAYYLDKHGRTKVPCVVMDILPGSNINLKEVPRLYYRDGSPLHGDDWLAEPPNRYTRAMWIPKNWRPEPETNEWGEVAP